MDKPIRIEHRDIVNFFDLSAEWQAEAIKNLDGDAEEQLYIAPLDHHVPEKHYLRDFSDCIRTNGEYDGGWQDSNNSYVTIKIHDDNQCTLFYF